MSAAARLDRYLKSQGVAVTGVSPTPSGGWRVYPPELQAQADAYIATFDPSDPAHAAYEKQQERDRQLAAKVIKALAIATHKRFKAQIATDATTAAQWEAAIRAEYDAL